MTGGRDTPVVQSLHPHRHCMPAFVIMYRIQTTPVCSRPVRSDDLMAIARPAGFLFCPSLMHLQAMQ